MVNKEGWIEVMHSAVDSVDIKMQPKENNNLYFKPLFVIYMLFCSMFVYNLLIEAVISIYEHQRQIIDKDKQITDF